jgi:hypothetical protein
MSKHQQHLNDGPVDIPAWKSCQGCRHFAQRGIIVGGDCTHPVRVGRSLNTMLRYIHRDNDDRVVTPSWCPVLVREAGG